MKSEVKISDNRLEMTRVFDAPRERVFAAWKDTDQLQQWWGCAMTRSVESQMDFCTGGSFSHTMDIEGAGTHVYSGKFDEVIEPEKIAYHVDLNGTIATVTVQFIDLGDKTRLVLVQEGFPEMPNMDLREIVSQGFGAAFEKLADLVTPQAA